jgi:hypothetical protein
LTRKTESMQNVENTQYLNFLKKYIKCNIWRVAVRPSYIQDARFLKVKQSSHVTTDNFVSCDVRTKVAIKETVFWDMVQCSRVNRYRSSGGGGGGFSSFFRAFEKPTIKKVKQSLYRH